IHVKDMEETDSYYGGEYGHAIQVAEYRLPEYQVKAGTDKAEIVQGQKIKITVNSSYFFGGGVSNADVQWQAHIAPYAFYKGTGRYSFVDYDSFYRNYFDRQDESNDRVIDAGAGKTDEQGNFILELTPNIK